MKPAEVHADLEYLRGWHRLAPGISTFDVGDPDVSVPTQLFLSEAWDTADLDVANVALVGLFSRGKSTLFNRLIGEAVSPVSQLPETAMMVEAQTGPRRAWGETTAGHRQDLDSSPDGFRATVTRRSNGGFVRARISGAFRLPVGLRLTDTPGVGSVDAIGDDAWKDLQVDAAIVVLSSPPGHSRTDVELIRDVQRRFTGRFAVVLQATDQSVRPESLLILAEQIERNTRVMPLVAPNGAPNLGWNADPGWADIERTIVRLADRTIADRYQAIAHDLARWCDDVARSSRRPEEIPRLQEAVQATGEANSPSLRLAVADALRRAKWTHDEVERRKAAAHFERIQQDLNVLSQFHFVRTPDVDGESNATLDAVVQRTVDELREYRWGADWHAELVRIRAMVTAKNCSEVREFLDAAVSRAQRDRDDRLAAERTRAAEGAARQLENWRGLRIVSFVLWFVAVAMLLAGDEGNATLSFVVWLGSLALWLIARTNIRRLETSTSG